LKYGRIHHEDLILHFKDRQVFKVTGVHQRLCADFETALLNLPGLRYVAELGVGQSHAITQAAKYQTTGCLWHERYFGVHLGLGAELLKPNQRITTHHLDLVLATGRLRGRSGVLMEW
jgi:hypothetical protein